MNKDLNCGHSVWTTSLRETKNIVSRSKIDTSVSKLWTFIDQQCPFTCPCQWFRQSNPVISSSPVVSPEPFFCCGGEEDTEQSVTDNPDHPLNQYRKSLSTEQLTSVSKIMCGVCPHTHLQWYQHKAVIYLYIVLDSASSLKKICRGKFAFLMKSQEHVWWL